MTTLRDAMHKNPGTFSGTPAQAATLLVRDTTDHAASFSVGDSFSIPDSASISLPVVVGGAAFELFFSVPSLPGAEGTIIEKSGSYGIYLRADGKIRFHLENGASNVDLVSTAAVSPGDDVHLVCVYNGGYTGDPKVGKTTQGATLSGMQADYMAGVETAEKNLQVCRFQMLERGQLYQINMDLERYNDNPSFQDVAAVAYLDKAGPLPDALAAQSPGQLLGSGDLGTQPRVWQPFPIAGVMLDEGDYIWLGYAGGARHTSEQPVMMIGLDTSGGTRKGMHSVVSASEAGPASQGVADPFGTPTLSDSDTLAVYADYTPLSRTGDEGHVLIYLDGQEDSRSAYTAGIADSANDCTGPTVAIDMDVLSFWDKKLGPVQVAKHYAAR